MADQTTKKLPVKETAWASDSIWSLNRSEKYNPDSLMGRKGAGIYKRMMNDEQVRACMKFKRDAITSREWFWEFDDVAQDVLDEQEKEDRILLCTQIVKNIKGSFTDKLNNIMTASQYGFSMNEKKYGQFMYEGKTYWGIDDIKLKPFDTFKFSSDDFGNITKLVQEIGGKKLTLDISNFIHMVNQPDIDEHYGQSDLRSAHRAWFSKDKAILHYNIFLERCALGVKTLKPINGKTLRANSAEYLDLLAILDNTTAGNGIILPSNIEIEIQWPSGKVEYPSAIDAFDLQIARSLLVPNLVGITPSGNTGSYSQSDTQLNAFLLTLEADKARLEEILNEHLFKELSDVNFGDDYYPQFRFKELDNKKTMGIIDKWIALTSGKAVKPTEADEEHVRNLLDFPRRTDDDVLLQDPAMNPMLNPNNPLNPANGQPGQPQNDETKPPNAQQQPTPHAQEETLNGKLVRAYSVDSIQKRVAFSVIVNTTNASEQDYATTIANHLYDATERALAENANYDKAQFDYTSGDKSKMNRIIKGMLKETWKLGLKHASMEIDKAKRQQFTINTNFAVMEADYVEMKSLKATGDLMAAAKSIIENVMLQGIKAGKTVDQIRIDIYTAFRNNGLLGKDVEAALGELLAGKASGNQIVNAQARIDTMIRTSMYDTLNEARFNYFNDPALGDFVEAFMYSAILDNRTTQICEHLDGKIYTKNSEEWNTYKPPNHYNCRSLLVPVVNGDAWTASDPPTVDPQAGFK